MRRLIVLGLAVAGVIPSFVLAAGAGNPAMNIGRENYGIAIQAEEQVKRIDDDLMRSRRYVGKIIWGATDRLDLFASFGASDLRVDAPGYPEFDAPPRNMTWGGGARFTVASLEKPKISTYVDVHMLSFFAKSTVDSLYTRYKYNEVQFNWIASWRRQVFMPYIGLGITHIFGHADREFSSGMTGSIFKESDDFREDAVPEFIIGMDGSLGGAGWVSGEIRLNSDSDISFCIGLSEFLR